MYRPAWHQVFFRWVNTLPAEWRDKWLELVAAEVYGE